MIEVFRLAIRKYAKPLSGKGAAISGGRWNSVGVELLYTASNRSLAMVEVVVHMTATTPRDYVMLTIGLPADLRVQELEPSSLPKDWSIFPYNRSTQILGDQFVAANESCVLRVPSAVTPGDSNLLLNPQHEDFAKIKIIAIEGFSFDRRLNV